jgi:hypothetical protein
MRNVYIRNEDVDSFTVTKPCDHCLGHKYCIGIGGFKSVCGNCGGTGHVVVVKIQTLEEAEAEHIREENVINALEDEVSQRLVFPVDNPNDRKTGFSTTKIVDTCYEYTKNYDEPVKPTKLICKKGRPKKDNK